MNRLLELLRSYGVDVDSIDATNPDLSGLDLTGLDDEQLAELHGKLLDLFDEVRDGDTVDLEALQAIAATTEALTAEDNTRQEQAEAAAAEIAELERRIRPDGSADGDGEGDDDAGGDTEDSDDGEGDPADTEDREAEAVAASAATPRRLSLSRLAAQRQPGNEPDPADADTPSPVVITAAGDIPGVSAGQHLDGLGSVAEAFQAKAKAVDGTRLAPGQRFHVAKLRQEFPDERRLSDTDAKGNVAKVEAVVASAVEAFRSGSRPDHTGFESLVAAGGLCAPLTARYDQDVVGTDARPIRDGLGATFEGRGGVRWIPAPTLADVDVDGSDAAVGVWTMDDDENALTESPTKPIQRIVCGSEQTVEVYAITKRLLVGNVLARTFPERVEAMITLTGVAQARLAEQRLLTRIKALSTQVALDSPQVLGSRRDLLAVWIKAAWALRNRLRLDLREPLQVIVPDAVIAHFRTDGLRQLPGDQRDRLTVDEVIGELRAIDVEPIITPDMPAHMAAAQAASAQLRDLPAPIEWAMFPMGTFGVVDGGELDLGFQAGTPVRDSDLNAVNDMELFGETFENVAKFGANQSIWGRTAVCPTGTTSGTTEVDCDEAS